MHIYTTMILYFCCPSRPRGAVGAGAFWASASTSRWSLLLLIAPPPLTTASHPGREEGLFSWISINFLLVTLITRSHLPLTTAHPGREEGLFSWVSVNFLLGNLQATGPKTVAAIAEMGGASLQVGK